MPFPSLLKRAFPYATCSPVLRGVNSVFSPVAESTSHKYVSLIEIPSINRIFLSSGDQSCGSQPPPLNCVSRRSVFPSAGFITHKSVSCLLRRVETYAIRSPPDDHRADVLRDFPSVNSVLSPVSMS